MIIGTCPQDTYIHLELPHKLYGRSAELEKLRTAFTDVSWGQQVTILISGYAGMGKTALVHEAIRSMDLGKGRFIVGKSDQLRQNIPYAPVAAALSNLVKQLMTQSQEDLSRWRKRISRALGRNGKVVSELVPELKWIVGEQPDIDALPPPEAQNRFRLVLRSFISAITDSGCLLVLFLDDLQWADPASIELLQFLIKDADLPYLLFIGAYREVEAKENKALTQLLESCDQTVPRERHFGLTPLNEDQAAELTAQTLHMEPEYTAPLALTLHRKTGGNPFFFRQLLVSLRDDGYLYYNAHTGVWQWDQSAIQRLRPGEDVLAFLTERLKKLPEETLKLLKLAACIGNGFHLETLALIAGKTLEKTFSNVQPAILEGLVIESERAFDISVLHKRTSNTFEFLHDRVQQATLAMIPEAKLKEMHVVIGRLLLRHVPAGPPEENILPIMDHFNRSPELISDPAERMELAGCNLMAGRKAKASAAYASALEYFRSGVSLLPSSLWESAYRLTCELHLELAQTEYLSANAEHAEELFDTVLSHAKTESERAEIYCLKVVLYAGMGKYSEAIQTGIRVLNRLGVRLPVPPRRLHYIQQILLCRWRMLGLKKTLTQPPAAAAQTAVRARASELLARLACIISIYEPRAYTFTIIKFSNYAIRYGNADMAAIGYMGYGIVAGSLFKRYDEGHRLACIGLQMAERSGKSYSKCYVNFVMGAILSHWTEPADTCIGYLNKAVEYGVEAGDLLLAGYSSRFILETGFLCGHPLNELREALRSVQAFARRSRHQYLALNTALYGHIIAFLQNEAAEDFCFDAEEFEESEFLSAMKNDNASQAAYHIVKMQLCYLSGDYEGALETARQIKDRMEAVTGFLITAEYVFYEALTVAALFDKPPRRVKENYHRTLQSNLQRMQKWAHSCKQNFLHKYLLMAAEMARLENRREAAMSLYDQAIEEARNSGYRQNQALACELAARFYLAQNRARIAGVYLEDAYLAYREWGAYGKANALHGRYGELLNKVAPEEAAKPPIPAETASPDSMSDSAVDRQGTDALQQAILMISRQDDPGHILYDFLGFAIRSADADKGILMLEREGKLWIEDIIAGGARVEQAGMPLPMETGGGFSKAIVRYVFRTLEKVVWNPADLSGAFTADAYALKEEVRSIACFPVLFRGIPAGVLYLENKRDEGAFTDERMRKLELLSEQLVTVKKLLYFLEGDQETQPTGLAESLTGRETDMLRLIAAGLSNKEISEKLSLSANTVKGYIKGLYGKLGASRRVQVAARAKALGLLKAK
jgi:histidine kinase